MIKMPPEIYRKISDVSTPIKYAECLMAGSLLVDAYGFLTDNPDLIIPGTILAVMSLGYIVGAATGAGLYNELEFEDKTIPVTYPSDDGPDKLILLPQEFQEEIEEL